MTNPLACSSSDRKRGKVNILETTGIAKGVSLVVLAPERGGHCSTIVALN